MSPSVVGDACSTASADRNSSASLSPGCGIAPVGGGGDDVELKPHGCGGWTGS